MDTKIKTKSNHFYLAVVLLLVFIISARTPLDTDLWWHLRAGEETVSHLKPLLADIFSYTRF